MSFVFTGRRSDDHYRVDMGGAPALLSFAELETLIALVCAALSSETGLMPITRAAIHRLRKALDRQLGAGAGKRFIHTGGGEEYRLAIPKKKIRSRIAIAPCFYELIARHVVTQEQADLLRKHCKKGKVRETET